MVAVSPTRVPLLLKFLAARQAPARTGVKKPPGLLLALLLGVLDSALTLMAGAAFTIGGFSTLGTWGWLFLTVALLFVDVELTSAVQARRAPR
jgi:hypothetical protein